MSEHLGLGVMIRMLRGNEEAVAAWKAAIGQTITAMRLDKEIRQDGAVVITLERGTLIVWDAARSCCECRYITTDDDLSAHVGATLVDAEVREAPSVPDEYEEHDVQFLFVRTSNGGVTFETHNEHNGYYGGFFVDAAYEPGAPRGMEMTP